MHALAGCNSRSGRSLPPAPPQVAERALRDADPAVRLLAPMQFYAMDMDDRGDAEAMR